jgi:hypothetical protein
MATDKITIQVDAEVADAYHSAAAEEQRKIQLLLRIFLREISTAPPRSLDEIMDSISDRAKARGLMPELLESMLNEP